MESSPVRTTSAASLPSRWAPFVLLAAFAALALSWNLLTPVFEAPDESTHFFVAQHIARTSRLPVQTLDVAARGPWEQEGSQPPLYYVLVAPLLRLSGANLSGEDIESRINPQNSMGFPAVVGNDNRFVHADEGRPWPAHVWAVRLARGLSTLLGLAAVAATWGLTRRVWGEQRPWLALATTVLFALHPQMLATFAALSNDPAIIALAALALWLLARLWDGQDDRRTVLGLAVVVGLAPLAKVSGLTLVAFALATVAWLSLRPGERGRGLAWGLRVGGAIVVATLLLAGWWYLRNLRLYGTLTGLNYMLPEGVGRELNLTRWLRGLPAELLGLWRSSWGLFGWFTLPLPAWTYALIDGATALAALGLARAGWAARGEGRSREGSGSEDAEPGWGLGGGVFALPPHVRPPWQRLAWLALWWLLLFAALLRWLLLVKGAHGRLLFPAWVFVAIALIAGWRSLLPRAIGDRALALAVGAAMLGLSLGALLGVIRPAFAGPSTIAEEAIPASATRVDALFGDGLRLLAVEHPARVVEGELLPVTLYWWVEGETSAEGAVAPAGGAPTETEGAAGGTDRAAAKGLARPGLVALRLDQIAAITGEDPDGGGRGALNHRPKLHRFAAEAYLAYPGAGTVPIVSLPPGRVIVDRHRIPVPMLVTAGADPAAFDDPARRFAMPVEARLSIHIYDRETGEAWPVVGADAAVGGAGEGAPATDVERRIVLESGRARPNGRRVVDRATPVAAFGEARALRLGLVTSVTEGSTEGRDVIYVAGPEAELGSELAAAQGGAAQPDGGSRAGQDAAGAAPPWLQHVVPDPRDLSSTWNATRVVWSVERAIERDLALFVHLVDEAGLVVRTFDGDPVTHGIYPSSLWRAGDVLVADLGWAVPDDARTGDRFTLLVGLYERVEGGPAPRLPAVAPDGERYLNDAVPLVAIEVGHGESGGMRRPDVGP